MSLQTASACSHNGRAQPGRALQEGDQQSCAAWTSDVAGLVSESACARASGDCPRPSRGSSTDEPTGQGPPPAQCYQGTTKDQCATEARTAAQASAAPRLRGGGSGYCRYWATGAGPCTTDDFQQKFEAYLGPLCDQVATGAQVSLP
ncbi:hypothetical protein PLESTB_000843400 [Pleodorina starrii]|uniref:Uncharacterized protein n=1 Tax=Pleodorina starrii TaxID=330485 RepID=A0A9W6F305_9CHLO|nr:hypothetical protein PLESTB_000843400 [Pleodorina starrii]GLC64415.1 hypothetical protein PLESTF_000163400 [Pleodorina starrii]